VIVVTRIPGRGRALSESIQSTLDVLASLWARELRSRPLPPLYQSGVRYKPEPWAGSGKEEWADPYTVFRRKWGDCDDLVLWRAAELRAAGHAATIQVMRLLDEPRYHVRVRKPDGSEEDPSVILL
jgi:hypothetical protein